MYPSSEILSSPARPKVLLVEDDTAVRRSLQLVLQARGFEVKAFASPELLLRDGATDDAACLVTDYRLSQDRTGVDLLRQLRRNNWAGPAVLITAYPSESLNAEAAQCGFAAVLAKPFRDRELADRVAQLVRPAPSHWSWQTTR